jgi:RES domain-containing protein
MFVYRVSNLKHKDSTLSGIGAEKVGGRWNEKGTRAVYCSENVSLALLEYYVHSENTAILPKEILIAKIEIPDAFSIDLLAELPENWNQYPYNEITTGFFTKHTKSRDFFALKVPSTIVGVESNFILNPLFKNFGNVEIVEFITLPIDHRLKHKSH